MTTDKQTWLILGWDKGYAAEQTLFEKVAVLRLTVKWRVMRDFKRNSEQCFADPYP